MSKYRIVFFLLIFSLLIYSCSTTKGLNEQLSYEETLIGRSSVLDNEYNSLLFKTRIKLYKKNYSGLFLIKKIASDTSTHIVFLSEIGLSILDLKYKNDEFELVSVKDFMKKSKIIKTIQNDFRMLIQDLNVVSEYTIKENKSDSSQVLKFKHKSQRYAYFYRPDTGLYKIWRKSGLFKTVATICGEEKTGIEISHRGIKLDINLDELEKVKNHADY
jgi:hypothetical protein